MNTVVTVNLPRLDASKAQDLAAAVFMEFDRIVKLYSRFDPNSKLSELNNHSGEWYALETEEFTFLIDFALSLSKKTSGLFDPTVIDLLELQGYNSKYNFAEVQADPDLQKKLEQQLERRPSWDAIELDVTNRRVKLASGQRIEFGGIGKGYALDQSAKILQQHVQDFLIDAGGDIILRGQNGESSPWKIGLKHEVKGQQGYVGAVQLNEGSICCSGGWGRRFGKFHHLLSRQTGKPVDNFGTVYTYHDNALTADSWSTIVALSGEDYQTFTPADLGVCTLTDTTIDPNKNFPAIIAVN